MIDISLVCQPEKTEAERNMIRQAFEQYSDAQRNIGIKGAIGTAATTYQAVSAAGPLGLLAIPVGMLSTLWSKKAYREQAYAYFDAMGWVKVRPPRRDIFYRDPTAWSARYFGRGCPGEVAYAIVHILSENDPALTDAELNQIGHDARVTFQQLKIAFPDVPDAVTADVILAAHGIYREPADGYVYEPPPENGFVYEPPEPPGDDKDVVPTLPPAPPDDRLPANDWLYAAAGLAVAFVLTRR